MKKIALFSFSAFVALMTLSANAAWTYDSTAQTLEDDDWTIASVVKKTAAGKYYLKISGAFTRKSGSASTTIDMTGAAAAAGASSIELWSAISSDLGVKKFIAPDVTYLKESSTFNGNTTIEEIELSPNATAFGHYAFRNTTALKTLRPTVFPLVTSLGVSLFENSTVEGDFEFPAVTTLNLQNVFLKAQKITSLKFATLTEAKQNYTFCGMTSLTNFYAPAAVSVSTIAFYHSNHSDYPCAKLESVTLSAEATQIPQFKWCSALKNLTPTKFPLVTSQISFQGCVNLTCDLSFPLVTSAPQSAFDGSAVTSVSLPKLATVPLYCFNNCTNLTKATVEGSAAAQQLRLAVTHVPDNFVLDWQSENASIQFVGSYEEALGGKRGAIEPENPLYPCIFKVRLTEDNRAALEAICTTTAANFTDAHRAIPNYPLVASKVIGLVGTPQVNGLGVLTSVSRNEDKGIFWLVDGTPVPSVDVTILCPEGVRVSQVTAGGYPVAVNKDGTYTVELANTMNITYVPTEGKLFTDGTTAVTVEDLTPAATIEASTCPKATTDALARIGDTLYLTLQEAANVGGEITLMKDQTQNAAVSVAADKTVSLGLNGKTLTASGTAFSVAGSLTVTGTGLVDTATPFAGAGTILLSGGTYKADVSSFCLPGYVATAQGTDPETWVVGPNTNVATLTLDAATFAAEHLSAVELVTTAPVVCTTNGTVISWQIAKDLPFALVYTVLGSYRFADRGKTTTVAYETGIASDTAASVADVPARVYHPTWSWNKSAGTCTDGNWLFTCSKGDGLVTVGDAEGIALTVHQAGCGDLDLVTFKDDVGENVDVIKLTGTLFRYKPDTVTNVCAPAVRYIDHRIFGSDADWSRPLKTAEFSPDLQWIDGHNFSSCPNLESFKPTVLPKLTSTVFSFSGCAKLTGDFSIPLVTALSDYAFQKTRITSLYAPAVEKIPQLCFKSCTQLTNVTILGSANTIPRTTISEVPDNFILNWQGTDAPTGFASYGDTSSILPANSLSPCIVRVTLTDENRAAWEGLCTTTKRNFTAAHRAISNYPLVRRKVIGFVGTPVTDKTTGELTAINAERPKGIFWVVNNDDRTPGFMMIVR